MRGLIQSQLQEEEINDSQSLLDKSECSESSPADKKKSKSVVVDKRFSWSPELVELLLRLTKQYKTKCDFNGHDFEADTQQMYTEIRRSMGRDFPDDFGLEEISEPDKDLRSMESDEYDRFMKSRANARDNSPQVNTSCVSTLVVGIALPHVTRP